MQRHVEHATRYLQAVASGATSFAEFLHPEVMFEELPNRVVPRGARSDLIAMQAAAERGQKLLRSQRYDVLSAVAEGERVVLEVAWEGILSVAFSSLKPGDALRARCAMVFEFRDDRIVAQRNYDCYEPF